MGTWEGVNCSTYRWRRIPPWLGRRRHCLSQRARGSPFVFADVQHAGWRDINFVGGILGVTFTFIFVNGTTPTDIDGTASPTSLSARSIIPELHLADRCGNIDVESVALHEVGNGLSQAHFGTVALKNDASLQASPRAVMNALYSGPLRISSALTMEVTVATGGVAE